jgi:hypothetical protein
MLYLLRQLGARIADFQKGTGNNILKITFSSRQLSFMSYLWNHVDHFDTTLKSSVEQYGLSLSFSGKELKITTKNKQSLNVINISFDTIIDSLAPNAKEQLEHQISLHYYVSQFIEVLSNIYHHEIQSDGNIELEFSKSEKSIFYYMLGNSSYFENSLLFHGFTLDITERIDDNLVIKHKHTIGIKTFRKTTLFIEFNMFMDKNEIAILKTEIFSNIDRNKEKANRMKKLRENDD